MGNSKKPADIRTQRYAVLDISGTTASEVTLMTLTDDNKAAFGFPDGPDLTMGQDFGTYSTHTWQNGILGAKKTTNCSFASNKYGADWHVYSPCVMLSDGQIFGYAYISYVSGINLESVFEPMFSSNGGEASISGLPEPFFGGLYPGIGSFCSTSVWDVSEKGDLVGTAYQRIENNAGITPASKEIYCAFLKKSDDSWLIFDGTGDYSNTKPFNAGMALEKADILPDLVNTAGWVAGTKTNNGNIGALWSGSSPMNYLGANIPQGMNDQGQLILLSRLPGVLWEDSLWENGASESFSSIITKTIQGQMPDMRPLFISNQKKPLISPSTDSDPTIYILATVGEEDSSEKYVFKRDKEGKWSIAKVQLPEGVSITKWVSINSSGVIAAIGPSITLGAKHALLLLPVDLVDTKDKFFDDQTPQGTTITEAMRDVIIEPKATVNERKDKSIAWIEPHLAANDSPQMPELVLRFRGTEQMQMKIKWKLKVDYKRPQGDQPNADRIRDQDLVLVPVGDKAHPDQQPFKTDDLTNGVLKIFDNGDWKNELKDADGNETRFFGGPVELTYQLLNSSSTELTAQQKIFFSIGGKCPLPDKCKSYIDAQSNLVDFRLVRLSYAVGKHESKDYNGEGSRYNQFWNNDGRRFRNDHRKGDPLWCKSLDEESAGGFGIFQITGDATHSQFYNVPREVMWNWQKNTLAYFGIVKTEGNGKSVDNDPTKNGSQLRFFNFVQQLYPTAYQNPPTIPPGYAYDGMSLDSWEMGVITLYNGVRKCPVTSVKLSNGKEKSKQNPWKFTPSAPSGSKWHYYPNKNDYLHEVIQQH